MQLLWINEMWAVTSQPGQSDAQIIKPSPAQWSSSYGANIWNTLTEGSMMKSKWNADSQRTYVDMSGEDDLLFKAN